MSTRTFVSLLMFICLSSTYLMGCNSSQQTPSEPTGTLRTDGKTGQAPSGVAFREVAAESGLNFQWAIEGKRPLNILQTIGNGVAMFDFNNDNNLDILLVSAAPKLYQGDGKGKFTDVSTAMGLNTLKGHFLGVAVGDIDNDGFDDLYLTAYSGGVLLRNQAGKGFQDATKTSGLPEIPWGTSATFFDLDGDGQLDLYVCNYVQFGPQTVPQLCKYGDFMSSCGPRFYEPEKGYLFRNIKGKFTNITAAWGANDVHGKGLGVAVADIMGASGKSMPSISLANDEIAGDLLVHQGTKLQNKANEMGTAYDGEGNVHGGMGTDWGDVDNDGKLDLFVATFQNEVKCLYKNEGDGLFTEMSAMSGLQDSKSYVTFGSKFLDCNNDGLLDLTIANGHVQDNINSIDKTANYRQPYQIFQQNPNKKFQNITNQIEAKGDKNIVGRGLATGDYDNDGKVDILITDSEGSPVLLHNEDKSKGNFITLSLVGTKSHRDAYGAIITAEIEGKKIMRHCHSDGSYLSASDKRVHLGLGTATKANITVQWPSGTKQTFQSLDQGVFYTLTEGKPDAQRSQK
jgi:enediyne biosynthesis protein E4